MQNSNLKAKNSSKLHTIPLSWTKSNVNGTFGRDIAILDPLETQQITKLLLSMYFWFASDRFCNIHKQSDFYIQNQCFHEYGCIIFHLQCQIMVGLIPYSCFC
eukprot:345028_1